MTTLRIRCRLFARYAELLGTDEVSLDLPATAVVADAVARVRASGPGAERIPAEPLVAVNAEHARLDRPLADGDEVALLPPLAGG